jgi:type VI secretion system protein ImpA
MALIDTELLLQPVSAAQPAGENLEYLPEFAALERAAEGRPERQMGSAVVPGEPPNHARVIELASELLGRSKDLRIAVKLVRSLLETTGLAGMAAGVALIRGLLERYWETLHPELDADDRDATMRMAALAALAAPPLVAVLRAAPLLKSTRFGSISLRDVQIATGELAQASVNPELDQHVIAGSFREADPGTLRELLAVLQVTRADLAAIRSKLESGPGASAPDFSSLDRVLFQAGAVVRPYVEQRESADRAAENEPMAAGGGGNGPPSVAKSSGSGRESAAVPGQIRGRDDVVHLLDRICQYYAENEPSSPLPLLLQRCRRLAALSFLDIVKDMAPEALSQVQIIAGKTEE